MISDMLDLIYSKLGVTDRCIFVFINKYTLRQYIDDRTKYIKGIKLITKQCKFLMNGDTTEIIKQRYDIMFGLRKLNIKEVTFKGGIKYKHHQSGYCIYLDNGYILTIKDYDVMFNSNNNFIIKNHSKLYDICGFAQIYPNIPLLEALGNLGYDDLWYYFTYHYHLQQDDATYFQHNINDILQEDSFVDMHHFDSLNIFKLVCDKMCPTMQRGRLRCAIICDNVEFLKYTLDSNLKYKRAYEYAIKYNAINCISLLLDYKIPYNDNRCKKAIKRYRKSINCTKICELLNIIV